LTADKNSLYRHCAPSGRSEAAAEGLGAVRREVEKGLAVGVGASAWSSGAGAGAGGTGAGVGASAASAGEAARARSAAPVGRGLARGSRGGRREEGLGFGSEAVMRRWEDDTDGGAMADE